MRMFGKALTTAVLIGLVLSSTPWATAQKKGAPAPPPPAANSAPAQTMPAPAPQRQTVIIDEPIRVFDPYLDYPYPYAYPPDYMAQNFGYVKIKTDVKDAAVYVDGGYADQIKKAKKFALRPGTHEIELRDSDGRRIYEQRVAVLVGKTTELHVG